MICTHANSIIQTLLRHTTLFYAIPLYFQAKLISFNFQLLLTFFCWFREFKLQTWSSTARYDDSWTRNSSLGEWRLMFDSEAPGSWLVATWLESLSMRQVAFPQEPTSGGVEVSLGRRVVSVLDDSLSRWRSAGTWRVDLLSWDLLSFERSKTLLRKQSDRFQYTMTVQGYYRDWTIAREKGLEKVSWYEVTWFSRVRHDY